jgi:radical SAM protein with 4Fe4S-binding SPASM domain
LGADSPAGGTLPASGSSSHVHRGNDESELPRAGERSADREALRCAAKNQRLSGGALEFIRSHYEEYWQGFRALFAETDVIAIGEPLVRAMVGLPPRLGGCGASTVRITPRATTRPCVYWPGRGEPLSILLSLGPQIAGTSEFVAARTAPEECRPCAFLDSCHGGCAGRRRIQNALHQPDFYCPIVRGEMQELEIRMAPARELPKRESACTTIVIARD